jgi:hypothetical protein
MNNPRSVRRSTAAAVISGLASSPAWAQPVGAASTAASNGTRASSALAFRQDEPIAFPTAGAMLLAVLLLVAGAAWLARRSPRLGGWMPATRSSGSSPDQMLHIDSSLRLDAQTRLYAVRWNERKLLVAVGGAAGPVVLDRVAAPDRGPSAS